MNIGYLSVNQYTGDGTILWDRLQNQKTIGNGNWFRHIRFDEPLVIRMDGRKGMAVISVSS
jgi:hypothetical protein